MKYTTYNLNLAAYLTTKGLEPIVKYVDAITAKFVFKDDCSKLVKAFYAGDAQVNLHKYIANRYMLKELSKKDGNKTNKIAPSSNKYAELHNTSYYWIDHTTNPKQVWSAVFGKNLIHTERKDAGNYYLSREEALKAAKL